MCFFRISALKTKNNNFYCANIFMISVTNKEVNLVRYEVYLKGANSLQGKTTQLPWAGGRKQNS